MASGLSRPWLERPAPTHPLLTQLADSKAIIGVQGPEEVLRVVLAAYSTFAAGRDWDPLAGTTSLDGPTVDACARLGRLIGQAGASDFEHGIQPGPVFHFDGARLAWTFASGIPTPMGARSRPSLKAPRRSAARAAARAVPPSSAVPDGSRRVACSKRAVTADRNLLRARRPVMNAR